MSNKFAGSMSAFKNLVVKYRNALVQRHNYFSKNLSRLDPYTKVKNKSINCIIIFCVDK